MPSVNDPLAAVKTYLFPMLLSGFTLLVWNDIREIKQDVKALMAQSNIDKTRIDNLERVVYKANQVGLSLPIPPDKDPYKTQRYEMVATIPNRDENTKRNNQLLDNI